MQVELTNMIMIQDKTTGMVVIQDRVKNWKGFSFPGGHVEKGESFTDSAIREAKEETGLDVWNLKSRGVIHWSNTQNFDRYLAFLYHTYDFDGELLPETSEGRNLWMSVEELFAAPSDNGMREILHMFLRDECSEAFGSWDDSGVWTIDRFM